jgi:hypothetical protein
VAEEPDRTGSPESREIAGIAGISPTLTDSGLTTMYWSTPITAITRDFGDSGDLLSTNSKNRLD